MPLPRPRSLPSRLARRLERAGRALAGPVLANPFELLLALMCLAGGLPLAAGKAPAPTSIDVLLPGWLVRTWGGFLLAGSVLVIVGMWRRHRSLAVELGGLALLGPAALAYALCILWFGGGKGLLPAGITAAFGLACYAQRVTVRRTDRLLRTYGRSGGDEGA